MTVAQTTTSRHTPGRRPPRTHGSNDTTSTAQTTSVTRSSAAFGSPGASSSLTTSPMPLKPRSTQSITKLAYRNAAIALTVISAIDVRRRSGGEIMSDRL